MATILEFRGSERAPASRGADPRGRKSAEVVIFPGVRFERWDRPTADPACGKSASKLRRDLLEID
jgi:hypothetical protein